MAATSAENATGIAPAAVGRGHRGRVPLLMMVVPTTTRKIASRERPAERSRSTARLAECSPEELMDAYVDGNAAAFDELYRRISGKLLGYLIRLTRHRERAEDLLQITFSKVHRGRSSYLRGAPLLPWMLAIARRSFYDERRAAASRPEDLSHDGTLPEPRSEDAALPTDIADALDRALGALPEAYREAISLTKMTGLSIAEAADVLDTTPTAVKLRVHRGYNALREALADYHRSKS